MLTRKKTIINFFHITFYIKKYCVYKLAYLTLTESLRKIFAQFLLINFSKFVLMEKIYKIKVFGHQKVCFFIYQYCNEIIKKLIRKLTI